MSATSSLPPRFDPLDPAVLDDPYPRYAELRDHGPIARGGPGTWLVTRHAEVSALLADKRLAHELPAAYHELSLGSGPACDFFQRIIFYRDPPTHTRLRRLMATGFTPRVVRGFGDRIRALVGELLEPAADTGHFDAIGDLAYPLALRAICVLLDIPPADQAAVVPRAADLAKGFSFARSAQEREVTDAATVWLQDYVRGLLDERQGHGGDDVLSRMLVAGDGGDCLTQEEIVDNCVFLFWAGFETVMSVVGTGCAALLRHPDEFRRLRAQPALVPGGVEEFLRYDAPIQGTSRIVREELQIGHQRIRPGRLVVLMLGAANHDERVFDDPDRLDVTRHPNPHVSFGGGAHGCLGNVLARAEAAIVFEELTRRFASFEPAGRATRRATMTWMRFHATIPVAVTNP